MFCTKCGTKLDDAAVFCHNCGVSVNKTAHTDTTEQSTQQTSENDTINAEFAGTEPEYNFIDSDVVKLIGKEKEDYYVARFAEMKQKDKKVTWNWCAFLFGPAWMIYRKMYIYGGLYWLISVLLLDKLGYFDFAVSILAGVFGNWLYMICLEKLAVDAKSCQEPEKSRFIQKNGGVSATGVFIGMGVVFTLSFVGQIVFGGLFG